jgi:hypothetical protein
MIEMELRPRMLVYIEWQDAGSMMPGNSSWASLAEVKEMEEELRGELLCRQVGWVVQVDEEAVVLSGVLNGTKWEDAAFGQVFRIPRGMVRRVVRLQEP